jgi:hypothetical protein
LLSFSFCFLFFCVDRNGSGTAYAEDIVNLLDANDYLIFVDPYHEGPFYHGLHKNSIYDIDRVFGSARFQLPGDVNRLHEAASLILKDPINPKVFKHKRFIRKAMDIIAIKRSTASMMLEKWVKD